MTTPKIINVKISDKIQKILDNISVQERTHEQLKNMYNNISSSKDINDYEKEALIEVVTKKIRIDFPAKAKKMLGSKDEQARILLEEIYATLNEEFDLSNPEINDVKPGIKVGGDMISGRRYVCRYFSFKTKDTKVNMGFQYNQETVEDEPLLQIYEREVGKGDEGKFEEQSFKIDETSSAIEAYKVYLKRNNVKKLF